MPRGIDSLLVLAFLSHTSSFLLSVDSRHVRTSENSDENSRRTGGGSEEFALSGRENVTHRRYSEETAGLSGISENFTNCTWIFDTLQAIDNETQIREATVPIAKLKRLARAKRETTAHRDDTADNAEDVAVQTGEEENLPTEGNSESKVPDDLENTNGAVEAAVEEQATPGGAEEDISKEPDAELTDKEETNEIQPDNENENKVEEEASTDGDVVPQENGESENAEGQDKNAQAGEDGKEEAVDEAGKEQAVDEAGKEQAVDEAGKEQAVDEAGGEQAVDEAGGEQAVDEAGGEQAVDEAGGGEAADKDGEAEAVDEDGEEEAADEDEDEGDVDYEAESEYEDSGEAGISTETLIEWGMGLTVQDVWNFIVDVEKLIAFTGDYILSLLLKGLKRELRRTGIHDKFKAKLEALAASPDLDRPKATEKLMKEIRKQFGRTFEQKIVEFLKELREGFKS